MARESCHRVTDSNARAVVDTQSRWERLDQSHPTVIGLPLQCNDSVCSVTDRLSLLSHRQTWRLTQAPSHGVCLLSHRQTWRLTQAPSHGVRSLRDNHSQSRSSRILCRTERRTQPN